MKCPRCQQEAPPETKFCAQCAAPLVQGPTIGPSSSSFADLQRALSTALEEQAATREVLRVVSSSRTDVAPVFDAILLAAVTLCRAAFGAIYRYDGHAVQFAGSYNLPEEQVAEFRGQFPMPPHRGLLAMRAIMDQAVVQVADLEEDPDFRNRRMTRAVGIRSMLAVPLRSEEATIGAIAIGRADVGLFADRLVELLSTFADQAVIAIENVRLFKELQASNRELTSALDTQTATSDILRVISRSQTDVQPVFDAIVVSAVRLCDARWGTVFRYDGALVHVAAHHNWSEEQQAAVALQYPMTPTPAHISGRAILTGATAQIPDIALDSQYGSALATQYGYRSLLAVPILRAGARSA